MSAAVVFDHVSFAYPGSDAPALEDISLTVPFGQRLGILGPNGGGKTTLLKVALGQLRPSRGSVQIAGLSPSHACQQGLIGYVPQRADIERGFPLSARHVIELAITWSLKPWQRPGVEARSRVAQLIELVGISPFADRPIGALSGGQTQRVMIARALANNPKLLILDEPTVGIDASGQLQFAELLSRVHAELGITILIVSHDLRAIAAGCDQVACLSRKLHFHDSPKGLTPQVLAELFAHDLAGIGGVLAGTHIHAHGPGEPCPVQLSISRSEKS